MYVRRAESGRVESKESVRRTWHGAIGSAETKRVWGRSWQEVECSPFLFLSETLFLFCFLTRPTTVLSDKIYHGAIIACVPVPIILIPLLRGLPSQQSTQYV